PRLHRDDRLGGRLCRRAHARTLPPARSDDGALDAGTPLHTGDVRRRARGALWGLATRRFRCAGDGGTMTLLRDLPNARAAEITEALAATPGTRIGRIRPL